MRVVVLGGIRSGKSAVAEALVADVEQVRYVATAAQRDGDADWAARVAAHRARRPEGWTTEELGGEPQRLVELLAGAAADEVLLVDDLGGWLTATIDAGGDWARPDSAGAAIEALADAVRDCAAYRLVLVTPEVGMGVLPATEAGRTFADASGTLNRLVATACDSVAFVVAGEVTWLRGRADFPARPEPAFTADGARAWRAPALTPRDDRPAIEAGIDLPMPDEMASTEATERLKTLDFAGPGLGALVPLVRFAAATQGRAAPRPWRNPRVLLLRGDHEGGFGAGHPTAEVDRVVAEAHAGTGALALLAAAAGATVQTVDCPPALPVEERDALDAETVDAALNLGWALAEAAVDEGADLLVLGSCGSGAESAATAVVAVITGGEPAALLGRVVGADGFVDDAAWMRRCVAVRDAKHRTRERQRDARSVLAMLGGGDIAVGAGILLGAAYRRTPVLIDGPVAVAAGLVARDFGAQTRHWLVMPDHGGHPTVKLAADVLGVEPFMQLRLGLGEGATALATLPLLNTALTLAAATPERPVPPEKPEPEEPLTDEERIEAEIQRVIVDSPTAELPLVQPQPPEPSTGD
jgi:nicotinate-nucleotide--dimethylbenzimidazole phosphoribosyltransferase